MTKIITLDGPSGSGKGTVGRALAIDLGFDYLDSGLLYRSLALNALINHLDLNDEFGIAATVDDVSLEFSLCSPVVTLNGTDVTDEIRSERVSLASSKIAKYTSVRKKFIDFQRKFSRGHGLIADGRDMGSVIFPSADLKIFLTASVKVRANRRYKELIARGENVSLRDLDRRIAMRDKADRERKVSPLIAGEGAIVIDASEKSVNEVKKEIIHFFDLIPKL